MTLTTLLWTLGGTEIIVILVIVLLLFGGKKIPELMRGLGKGIREFKDASAGNDNEKPTQSKE
jgi:sec-independent protein translocase protein TatA